MKTLLPCLALTFMAGAIIIYPERYISCCYTGFALWAQCVLPSLFPFMVITLILIKTGFAEKAALPLKRVTGIFNLPPAAAVCFIISMFSGYPAGAKALTEFYESGCFSQSDCKKLSLFCSTSGPLFILGSVGVKMLGQRQAGWKILAAHLIAVLAVGLMLSFIFKKGESRTFKRAPVDKNVLYNSFYGAVISVAVAGGFIAFFCVAAQILTDFNILLPIEKFLCLFTDADSASAVSRGLIEITAGCKGLAEADGNLTLPFAGFLITFGGVSIIMQQLSYLLKAKVNPLLFVGVKLLQGVVCFLILLLI